MRFQRDCDELAKLRFEPMHTFLHCRCTGPLSKKCTKEQERSHVDGMENGRSAQHLVIRMSGELSLHVLATRTPPAFA